MVHRYFARLPEPREARMTTVIMPIPHPRLVPAQIIPECGRGIDPAPLNCNVRFFVLLGRAGTARLCRLSEQELTITADCGGSNGARVRLWKVELQKLADETGLTLHVHHYPPGTSKWNKIEHRLFCHITQNWRGRPLTDRVAVVELIGATTTKAGLKVECALDTRTYQKGIKVSDAEMEALDITGDAFHPEWNYTIKPRLLRLLLDVSLDCLGPDPCAP
jgi:hypothetical protein